MAINFKDVTKIVIPAGEVTKITRTSDGVVLWQKGGSEIDSSWFNGILTKTFSNNSGSSYITYFSETGFNGLKNLVNNNSNIKFYASFNLTDDTKLTNGIIGSYYFYSTTRFCCDKSAGIIVQKSWGASTSCDIAGSEDDGYSPFVLDGSTFACPNGQWIYNFNKTWASSYDNYLGTFSGKAMKIDITNVIKWITSQTSYSKSSAGFRVCTAFRVIAVDVSGNGKLTDTARLYSRYSGYEWTVNNLKITYEIQ